MQEEINNSITICDSYPDLSQKFQCLTNHLSENSKGDSTSFHKVIALNNDCEMETLPQIMILQSMDKFGECHNNFQFHSSCSESNCSDDLSCCMCHSSDDDLEKDTVSIKTVVSCESDNLLLKEQLCELKECFQNVFNENQELHLKLTDILERNSSLVHALKQPAPFKISSTGEIRFPGKKVMEKKLFEFKREIAELSVEIGKQQINQLKLKLVEKCIEEEYNNMANHCQCENPRYQNDIQTIINVKKQKIKHIEVQLKQKKNELTKTKSDYDSSLTANDKINAKIDKLSESIAAMNKKIEECNSKRATGKYLKDDLDKKSEDIKTMELLVENRAAEIKDYNEKLKKVHKETKTILDKAEQLENALKILSKDFNDEYTNLESNFKEQMEEMMALPTLLSMTNVKLQEENDHRVMAEEKIEKLERQIKQAESIKTPCEPEDEVETGTKAQEEDLLIAKQLSENKALELKLKSLEDKINSAKAKLNEKTGELDALKQEIQNAEQKSIEETNAFGNFLTINKEGLANDMDRIKELLTELRGKECEKALNKKEAMVQLKSNIELIFRKLEKCKLEIHMIMDNQRKC